MNIKFVFKLARAAFEKYTQADDEIENHNKQIQANHDKHKQMHEENQVKIQSLNSSFKIIRYR